MNTLKTQNSQDNQKNSMRKTEHVILGYAEADQAGKEASTYYLGQEFDMSNATAWRILHKYAYRKLKPT